MLQVERIKVDEMRLPEKVTFTLPKSDASSMQAVVTVLNENLDGETLLKTEHLTLTVSMVSIFENYLSAGALCSRRETASDMLAWCNLFDVWEID